MKNQSIIHNPKKQKNKTGRFKWYPYYADYSEDFVEGVLQAYRLKSGSRVADPWNGSGTTTSVAARLGFDVIGYDLNPVMVVTAKARMLSNLDVPSLSPIVADIVHKTLIDRVVTQADEPLDVWFVNSSALYIRKIEAAIQKLLVDENDYIRLVNRKNIGQLSSIACFFYVALFRTLRHALSSFYSSNPTWVKKPKDNSKRLNPKQDYLNQLFQSEVNAMILEIDNENLKANNRLQTIDIAVANSVALPIPSDYVDMVISSPPYCTRIDYAVATMPELALLGYEVNSSFDRLRRSLIGTSTVPYITGAISENWGTTCLEFLDKLANHNSKASRTYYLKNHLQYFDAIFNSIGEIARILKPEGKSILVVQDSYYKDIHNNLPRIFIEMAASHGLKLKRRIDFNQSHTMAAINPAIKTYRRDLTATESVLMDKPIRLLTIQAAHTSRSSRI